MVYIEELESKNIKIFKVIRTSRFARIHLGNSKFLRKVHCGDKFGLDAKEF